MSDDANTPALTNSYLAGKLNTTTDYWIMFINQLRDWLAGEADGGPEDDGRYPLTNGLGVTFMVQCPAKLASTIEGPSADAVAAQLAAEAAQEIAETHAMTADQQRQLAEAARNAAQAARDLAESYKNQAGTYQANALVFRNDTEAFRDEIQANVVVLFQGVSDLANAVADQEALAELVTDARDDAAANTALIVAMNDAIQIANSNIDGANTNVNLKTASVDANTIVVAENTALVLGYLANTIAARDATFTARDEVTANTTIVLVKADEVAANTTLVTGHLANVITARDATYTARDDAQDAANTATDMAQIAADAETSVSANAIIVTVKAGEVGANTAIVLTKADEVAANTAIVVAANVAVQAAKTITLTAKTEAVDNAVIAANAAEMALYYLGQAQAVVGGDFVSNLDKATTLDAEAGVNDSKWMTPAKTKAAILALAGDATEQFSITVTATGAEQTVDLGAEIELSELLIFENGLEQDGTGFVMDGTEITFTREAGSHLRFMLSGGYRGRSFEPDLYGNSLVERDAIDIANSGIGLTFFDIANGVFYFSNTVGWSEGVSLRGPQGIQGPQGNAGVDGTDGADGVGISNATIADGWLTLTYSNSAVANVGYVVGPQGIQGPQGNAGANGTSVTYSSITAKHLGVSNAVGVANVAAREDHVHQFPLSRISNTVITANATITANDHGGIVEYNFSNSSLILPNDLPVGFNCLVRVANATGVPTFAGQSGASIRQADSFTKARKQWSEVSVSVRSNANGVVAEYVLSGDMA